MAEQKLHYALRSGQLVSIDDVERGLQCNCVCPSCGAALIARKGDKREHHFAHYGDTDCSGGVETALHLLAKKLLCSTKTVFVPGIDRDSKGSVKTFLSAAPESRDYSSFIPDIVLRNKTEALAIEILVTHAVDEGKAGRIKEAQLPTIEIDLSGQIEIYNERTVLKAILSGESTEWIYHPFLETREKEKCIREELCDYLPPICDISKPYYKCPKIKRTVSVLSHCSECPYYLGIGDPSGYETYHDILCAYRLRDVPIDIHQTMMITYKYQGAAANELAQLLFAFRLPFSFRFLFGHEQAPADDGFLEFGGAAREGEVKPAVPDLPYPAALHLAGAAVHIIEGLA
ncbi:MAG: hypothetical protein IJI13_10065 [Oscillospiraceae bacterium]|nr:hypothetical protein [Oscillospiraceae bacterium]